MKRLRQIQMTTGVLLSDPSQLRFLARALREWGRSTLELRQPWWPYPAIRAVFDALPPGAQVLEWGSGGSTLWLEDRGAWTTSIEHDPDWYESVSGRIGSRTVLELVRPREEGVVRSQSDGRYFDAYIEVADRFADGALDFVIVDGRCRVACVSAAAPKLRPGGRLLLDDSDREQYRAAHDMLRTWRAESFRGLKPSGGAAITTLFTRPS